MKRLSKYLVLLLAVLVVAVCFVGCGEAKVVTFKNADEETLVILRVDTEGKVYEPRIAIGSDEEIVGWYRNKEGTGDAFNFLTDKVEENTTLYVKIRTVTDRIVTFKNADEETLVILRVDTEGKVYEPRIAIGSDEQVVGWYTDKEYTGTAFNFQTDTVEESITLYVKISTLSDTIVTFKNSNGDVLSSVVASKEGKINEPKVEVTEGVTLEGWYTDSDYSGTAFNFETGTVTESTTLYAKFSTNQYTVTYVLGFEPEEGEDITAPTQDSVNHNGTFTVKAAPNRQEYMEFVGWSDGVNLYQEDDIYLVSTNNVVLIGIWNVIQYEVNFFDENGDQIGNTVYVPRGCAAESPYVAHPLFVFEFDGWDRDISAVTEDMDVNATFRYVPTPDYYFDFIPAKEDNGNVIGYKVKFGADKSNPGYNPEYTWNSTMGFYGNGLWAFPDYYRGLPVIGFAQTFENLGGQWGNEGFELYENFSLYLPDTFESLDFLAFTGCHIDTIYVGSGLKYIDKYAFNQNNIKTWVVSEENEYFCSDGPTLYNKDKTIMITTDRNVTEFVVPVGVTEIYPNFMLTSWTVRTVIIEGDIDVIGDGAFGGTDIEIFTINGSVKRLQDSPNQGAPDYRYTYPVYAAIGCSEITYLHLKGIEYIGFGAVSNCASLTELVLDTTLEHLDNEGLSSLGYLESIKYAGNAKVSNNGKYVIENNAVIEKEASSIMLADGETPGDVFILYASHYAGGVYVVPNTVREFAEWAFTWTLLEEVILPEGIEAISGGMFYYAEGLKSLTIPSSVLRFELSDNSHGASWCGNYSPFERCLFESIIFADDCKITEFPKELFFGSHLKTLNIPASIISISDDALNTGWLSNITIPETNEYFSTLDGVLYNNDKTVMLKYPASKADETFTMLDSVLTIKPHVAKGARFLKHLITNEGLTDLPENCFSYSTLETVSFASTIASINSSAFEGCFYMREMEFKSTVPPTITYASYSSLFTVMEADFPGRLVFKVPYESYDAYYTAINEDFWHQTRQKTFNVSDQIDVSNYPDAYVTKYEFMDGEEVYQTIKAKKLRDYPVPEPKTVGETTKYFVGWYSEPGFVNEITLPWTPVVNDMNTVVKYYAKWSDTPRVDGSAPAFAFELPFGQEMTVTVSKANSKLFFLSNITFEGEWTLLSLELLINGESRGGMTFSRGLMETDKYSLNAINFDSFLNLTDEGEVTVTLKFVATFSIFTSEND